MRAHADHFRDFVLAMDTADGAVAEGEDVFEAYCAEVEGSAAWGGQVEIQALSAALRAHVQVFAVGMPALEVGEEFEGEGGGPTLRVCYLRHAYGLGEHYNSVVGAAPRGGGGGGEAGEGSGSGSEEEDEA
jgi:OTU domain-containing protein 6